VRPNGRSTCSSAPGRRGDRRRPRYSASGATAADVARDRGREHQLDAAAMLVRTVDVWKPPRSELVQGRRRVQPPDRRPLGGNIPSYERSAGGERVAAATWMIQSAGRRARLSSRSKTKRALSPWCEGVIDGDGRPNRIRCSFSPEYVHNGTPPRPPVMRRRLTQATRRPNTCVRSTHGAGDNH